MGCLTFTGEVTIPAAEIVTGEVSLPVIFSEPPIEPREAIITENGVQNVTPNPGYYGLDSVQITTNVQPPLEEVTVEIENGSRVITPSEGYYGISKATVTVVNPEDEWKPNPTWWDIENIVQATDNQEYPYKAIQLLTDSDVTTYFQNGGAVAYKTSDGAFYTKTATHTWDTSKDKQCFIDGEPVYKTRWVITYWSKYEGGSSLITIRSCLYFIVDKMTLNNFSVSNSYILQSFNFLNGADFDKINSPYRLFSNCYSLVTVPPFTISMSYPTCVGMFASCYSLRYIPYIDTSRCENFSEMFQACRSLKTIPVLDTSNGTNFGSMFLGCSSLRNIPTIDVSNGTNFGNMFRGCSSLERIPTLNVSKGINFGSMFSGCGVLKQVPFFDTSNGLTFENFFSSCISLKNIPALDFSKGEDFNGIFNGCHSLTCIGMFDSRNVKPNRLGAYAFTECFSLVHIHALIVDSKVTFSYSNQLSKESMLFIIEHLPDVTGESPRSITFNSNNLAKLTVEEKAIATSKNWTLS